jgi:hypothetical protein
MSFAGGALKGVENLKTIGNIARKGAITGKDALKGPITSAAQNKIVQRAAFPALAGGSIGIGSYAALTGAGQGFKSFAPVTAAEGAKMTISIIAVVGILLALVVIYGKFIKAGKR